MIGYIVNATDIGVIHRTKACAEHRGRIDATEIQFERTRHGPHCGQVSSDPFADGAPYLRRLCGICWRGNHG